MNLLPNNWTYAKINDLISNEGIFVDGDWIESKDQNPKGKVRLIQLADIGDGIFRDRSNRYLTKEKSVELGCTYLKKQDILVARLPEPLGRACIFPLNNSQNYITAVDICVIRPENKYVNIKYLLFLINSPTIRIEIDKLKSGTTRKRISRKNFAKIDLPIAPMHEQSHIAEKIEELFSDLDKATKDLIKTQEQLKIYRQAVLKAAFEDKIGVNRNDIKIEKIFKLGELINGITYKKSDANNNYEIGYKPILRANNIDNNILNFRNLVFVPLSKIKSYQYIKKGDIVFCMSSGSKHLVGKSAMANLDYDGSWGAFCSVLRPNNLIIGNYLQYFFQTKRFRNYISNISKGTNINNLKKEHILEFEIPVLPKPIQEEIINEIESRLSVCDKLEETIEQSLKKMKYLRQSILKKAFEGKLVPQDPNDPPAGELLKQIKIKKDKMSKNGK